MDPGKDLKLIIVDGCASLVRAIETVYHLWLQVCWVHKLRNIAVKLPRRTQAECLRGAKKCQR